MAEHAGARNAPAAIEHIFRVRSRVIAGFGLALPFLTGLGDERWYVVAAIALVALPYNLFLERTTRRTGEIPWYVPWADLVITVGGTAFVPGLWELALILMVALLAMAATVLQIGKVIGPGIAGLGMAAAVGYVQIDAARTTNGLIAYAGSAAIATFGISVITRNRYELESEHRELVENIDAVVWELEAGADRYRSLSPAAVRLLGYPAVNLVDVVFWMDHVHVDDRPLVERTRQMALETGRRQSCDYRMTDGAGRTIWFHEVVSSEQEGSPRGDLLRGVVVDVTARRLAEEERAVYGQVVENIDTAIVVTHPDPNRDGELAVTAANPAAGRIFGTSPKRIVGGSLAELLEHADGDVPRRAAEVARGASPFLADRVSGVGLDRQRTYQIRVWELPGRSVGLMFEDVTEATMVATALRRQALHDGLTGLPNRTLLRDRLQYALSDARRRQERVALILLDLNHFKDVNDALGHQYGDRLLVAFSRRLQALLRECDTIARLGGDEFALLLTDATQEGASRVVSKVSEAMQEPFEIEGITVQTTASIGVALFPEHAEDADLLTQRADVAMYSAKRGGGGWAVYSPQQDKSSVERLRLLSELHSELEHPARSSITLHYQPIVDLRGNRISGAEALLRWNHPEFGWLDPELVVELAELSGLIQPLAHLVARNAMQTAESWRAQGHDIRVGINLSARNLYDRHLVGWLKGCLDEVGLPADLLKCELTESQVMDDPVLAMSVIAQLRDIGIHSAIDDFGTGYSSLAYLRRLEVDEIKIDKSFVMSMREDPTDRTIVRTIIDLSHNLGMTVLAEGVEDEETVEMLREYGCDRVQGFHVGRPMPAPDLARVLDDERAVHARP